MGWLATITRNQRWLIVIVAFAMAAVTLLRAPSLFLSTAEKDVLGSDPPVESLGTDIANQQEEQNAPSTSETTLSSSDIKLAELLHGRRFAEILQTADSLFTEVSHRTRESVYLFQGDINKAERELDLDVLRGKGYPDNIREGYYRDWPILRLTGQVIRVDDRAGNERAHFDLPAFLGKKPGKIWTYEEMQMVRNLISAYQGESRYGQLLSFLPEGYAPYDYQQLIELDLLRGRYDLANDRLNLLRLILWESGSEFLDVLSLSSSLLQDDYASARIFFDGDIEGFQVSDVANESDPSTLFLDLALSLREPNFESKFQALRVAMSDYQVDYPFYLHDRWFDQPVLEKWLASLRPSKRSRSLREAWWSLKAHHGMADLYAYMYQEGNILQK